MTRLIVTLSFCFLSFHLFSQDLWLARVFSDHMVLQREQPVTIWGWSKPEAKVELDIDREQHEVRADINGRWQIKLSPFKAGGPYKMAVNSGEQQIIIKDILFGDVWICSGQSNMQYKIENFGYSPQELGKVEDEKLRYFGVPTAASFDPEEEITGGAWLTSNAKEVGQFSAVGFYFAQQLREHSQVPIGILDISWGGSAIEAWMETGLFTKGDLRSYHKAQLQKDSTFLRNNLGLVADAEINNTKIDPSWFAPDCDDSDWLSHRIPQKWEDAGYEYLDGVLFYRKTFELINASGTGTASLHLSTIDDSDATWLNGSKIGETRADKRASRVYNFPANLLKQGTNVLLVKVEDLGGGGGIRGLASDIYLQNGNQKTDLTGMWKFKVGQFIFRRGPDKHYAALLYNTMVHPLLRFRAKGIAWYQGENNAIDAVRAYQYREQFPQMIKAWREAFQSPDLPFLYVQLANFRQALDQPRESNWAILRESQQAALKLPKVAEAVVIDIGDANDIHPRNKKDVGKRLSLAARNLAYAENNSYASPMYVSHKTRGNKLRITFKNVAGGLQSDVELLRGFAIAGKTGKFVWAKARVIDKNTVEVWSDAVIAPKHVRYAWADNPGPLDLYNSAGLPASPFRTDEF